jgi:hypothetical protein
VQRLFSTFADGWPGVGLLLLRLLAGAALIGFGVASVREGPPPLILVLQIIGVAGGIVLVVGFFTPIAGALAAIVKVLDRYLAIFLAFRRSMDSLCPSDLGRSFGNDRSRRLVH